MGRNQQVLLVDADLDHRASLKQLLGGLTYAVVGEANYGVEASRLATELQPDIILVHIEEPLALAFRTLEVVQLASPRSTPVVVSQIGDAETVRKAMIFGARGYIFSPANDKQYDDVLSKAHERHQALFQPQSAAQFQAETPVAPIAGEIITVFGPKGGVGKTTLSTNLAIGVRKHTGARVALVDMDTYFGDVAIMMGIEADRTMADYVQALRSGTVPRPQDFLTMHSSGVEILAAPHGADMGPQPSADEVAQIVRQLASTYDFVVVDTPGAFGPLVAAALDESSIVLMVTSADMASIKDTRLSLDILRGAGFDPDRLKLVINHATNANSVTDSDVARTVNYEIFWTVPHDRAVPVSTQHGTPLVLSNPRAAMAQRVDSLAAHLCGMPTAQAEQTVASRRFGFAFLGR